MPIAQHAEYKAIASYNGVETLKGCTLYVTTAPCNICAKLIAQSKIAAVVYGKELGEKNLNVQNISKEIFAKCSIDYRFIEQINAAFCDYNIIMLSILENLQLLKRILSCVL